MLPGWDKLQDMRKRVNEAAEAPNPDIKPKISPDITQAIADAADRITAHRVTTYGQEGGRVSKLGAISERIAAKKLAHDKKADEWAARLDALDMREPDAFAIGDAVIAERETDLGDMESNMRKLSNLPNVVSGKS